MCAEIEREIELARAGKDAANALCATGLLAYTEFMANLLPAWRRISLKTPRDKFEAFFRDLGEEYGDLMDKEYLDVYEVFRLGIMHEYFVKDLCTIAMLNSPGSIVVQGGMDETVSPPKKLPEDYVQTPAPCGLGATYNGSYFFIVEKYYQDFRAACEKLLAVLEEAPSS
jgi:hypothetical protein